MGRRTRLCKGCTLAFGGAGVGLVAGWIATLSAPLAAAGAVLSLVPLAFESPRSRASKLGTRLLPALGLATATGSGLHLGSPLGLAVAAVSLGVGEVGLILYRRRGPHRSPCTGCPERVGEGPCSGFAEIYRRELAFRRLSARWMDLG